MFAGRHLNTVVSLEACYHCRQMKSASLTVLVLTFAYLASASDAADTSTIVSRSKPGMCWMFTRAGGWRIKSS